MARQAMRRPHLWRRLRWRARIVWWTRMTKYWLLRIASWLVPLVPFAIARPLAEWGGTLAWMLSPGARRRVERNLRHIPALIEDPARLQRASRGVFQATSLNYLDFLRGSHL